VGEKMAGVRVVEAKDGKEFKDFIEVPYIVQGDNPVWVPPLRVQAKEVLDEKKHPFYAHAVVKRFIAYKDNKPAGRIMAINDDLHNETHKETTCLFGFFESINDLEVSRGLFDAVEKMAKEWNLTIVRGPFNPSINEDIGILMDAYDLPAVVMMTYNPDYYPKLLEKLDYGKAMDVYAYRVTPDVFGDRVIRAAKLIQKRAKVKIRHMSKKHFWEDANKLWGVYNKAWEKNWGAVPFTHDEFMHLAKDLKTVIDYDLIVFAENEKDELVGFSMGLPNINEAKIKIRDGKLLPFGLPKLMWHTRTGAIPSIRIVTMGVLEEYRKSGIDTLFHYDNYLVGKRKGYKWAELGWVLETNTMMNRVAEMIKAERYKTYRVYEKSLNGHLAL
jgi:hypothetical protein